MNKKILSKFALVGALMALPFAANAAPDPNFHIYLMIGQSNMEGAAPIEAQDNSTHPRVQCCRARPAATMPMALGARHYRP